MIKVHGKIFLSSWIVDKKILTTNIYLVEIFVTLITIIICSLGVA